MRQIYWYTLKAYLGPFVLTFFIALFILLMQFLWVYIDDLVGKGLEWHVVGQLLFYASSTFVPLALPLAILLSSLMTFGNLGEHYELVAMKASGISLWKIMRPLVVLSLVLSLLAFLFSNYVLPIANLKFRSLLYDVRQQKLAFDLEDGIFYNGLPDYVIRANKKDPDGQRIYGVQIYNHSDKRGNTQVTIADWGRMELSNDQKSLVFTLYDGSSYTEVTDQRGYRDNRPFEKTFFDKQKVKFDMSAYELSRHDENLFKSHYSMLNIRQLNFSIDSLIKHRNNKFDMLQQSVERGFLNLNPVANKSDSLSGSEQQDTSQISIYWPLLADTSNTYRLRIYEQALDKGRRQSEAYTRNEEIYIRKTNEMITKHQVVWHKKFTLSFACLILFFIGAPLGAIIRKGGLGLPVVISVVFFVLYHVSSMLGERAAKAGELEVFTGMWLSSIILLPIGLFLTFKATTDASLLDADSWKKAINRLLRRKKP